MTARNFFFAAAGIFFVVASYAVGSSRAQAQVQTPVFVAMEVRQNPLGGGQSHIIALTNAGDWYWVNSADYNPGPLWQWHYGGNIVGGTVATQPTTFGQAKRALSR